MPVLAANMTLQRRQKRLTKQQKREQEAASVLVDENEDGTLTPHRVPVEGDEEGEVAMGEEGALAEADAAAEAQSTAEEIEAREAVKDLAAVEASEEEAKAPAKRRAATDTTPKAKFIPLKDIMPKIPKKGTFDVNEIKVRGGV